MSPRDVSFEEEVKRGLARSIVGEKDWGRLTGKYGVEVVTAATLDGLKAIVLPKQVRAARRRARWRRPWKWIIDKCNRLVGREV